MRWNFRLYDQHHLAGLHASFAIRRDNVGLNYDGLTGKEWFLRHRAGRSAFATENRRQISPAVAVQKIVDDRETRLLDDA